MSEIWIHAPWDHIGSRQLRILEEAARLGPVSVALASDEELARLNGKPPDFPLAERLYFLRAMRHAANVFVKTNDRPHFAFASIPENALAGFPVPPAPTPAPGRKNVVVTGCYDWLHSGHVRFFEEASGYGDLYVIVGNDAAVAGLKGPGHPMLKQEERRYLAGSVRFVAQALISSGSGWLDADAEIQRLKPDYYIVNEDGDKGGKADYCAKWGIQYLALKRAPAPGLPRRTSTELRGF